MEVAVPDNQRRRAEQFRAPPPQENLERAAQLALEAVARQSEEQLLWLGAERAGGAWRLPVLDDTFLVDLSMSRIMTSAGQQVGLPWSILALHYLAIASRPEEQTPEVMFADLATARSYAGVYHGRVNARLCATVGRDGDPLRAAAGALGGRPAVGGDAAFDFAVFPRLLLRLVWHAPDDEFPASATLLLPANIEAYLCSEDIVVLSERLVSRLCGRPF
jgi:hypothetical protein